MSELDPHVLLIEHDPLNVVLRPGIRPGLSGAGSAGQVAVWAASGLLAGYSGLAWDDANKELDVSGPGTNNGTVYVVSTGSGGIAVNGEATGAGGAGVWGLANSATGAGVTGLSSAGKGVDGVTTGGIGVRARVDGTGGTGVQSEQPSAATGPAYLAKINNVDTVALSPVGKGGGFFNSAALANNATGGFLGLPSCPGTPTGTPTIGVYPSGVIPALIKSSDGTLWIYVSGAWAQVAGGGGGSTSFVSQAKWQTD